MVSPPIVRKWTTLSADSALLHQELVQLLDLSIYFGHIDRKLNSQQKAECQQTWRKQILSYYVRYMIKFCIKKRKES